MLRCIKINNVVRGLGYSVRSLQSFKQALAIHHHDPFGNKVVAHSRIANYNGYVWIVDIQLLDIFGKVCDGL